jgi:hypothetical protein
VSNPLKDKAKEWKKMASVLYVKALAGDEEAIELMRDAIQEAANLFENLEFVEEAPTSQSN